MMGWILVFIGLAMIFLEGRGASKPAHPPEAPPCVSEVCLIEAAASAMDDGRFEDASYFIRAAIEPNVAECRWDQFLQHIRRAA